MATVYTVYRDYRENGQGHGLRAISACLRGEHKGWCACPTSALPVRHWQYLFFTTPSRSVAQAMETVWMNYAEPKKLDDCRDLGNSVRE